MLYQLLSIFDTFNANFIARKMWRQQFIFYMAAILEFW